VAHLEDDDYARLLALRTGLRRFERWSAEQAEAAGLTAAQHQLLLAVRGHQDPAGPTVGDVADYLLLRHHSAVGLIDRAEAAGLVERHRNDGDHRVVRLRLTPLGQERLTALSTLHLEELARLAQELPALWSGLAADRRGGAGAVALGSGGLGEGGLGGGLVVDLGDPDLHASQEPASGPA
jgi:DNA-binding MarR family transcriptional regulator